MEVFLRSVKRSVFLVVDISELFDFTARAFVWLWTWRQQTFILEETRIECRSLFPLFL